jgi:hypothetical protein
MKIELRIDRLVVDGLGPCPSAELVMAITRELRLVLARDLARPQVTGHAAVSVRQLRAELVLPAATPTTTSLGQSIGTALAGAVTSERVFPHAGGPR